VTWRELRTDVVVLVCAVSAGIHAALTPEHFREAIPAGLGFASSVVALAVIAPELTRRPDSAFWLAVAAVVLVGLIVAYVLAVTTGVPVLMPEPEPVDGLALVTKAVEALGVLVAASALRPRIHLSFNRLEVNPT
jgi:hypothetical protein